MASVLKVDKLDPQSGTALEIGTSGDTISIPSGATLDISASTLTPPATMPASSGVNLTALNATQLTSGTVPAARLSGTGKIGQVIYFKTSTELVLTTTTYTDLGLTAAITPSATSSSVLVLYNIQARSLPVLVDANDGYGMKLFRDAEELYNDGGSYSVYYSAGNATTSLDVGAKSGWSFLDTAISTTSEVIYKVQVGGTDTTSIMFQQGSGSLNPSDMILMEVLA